MASTPSPAPPASTPIPKSYAQGVAATPDPWDMVAQLDYGADRTFAWSVIEHVMQTGPAGRPKLEERLLAILGTPNCTVAGRAFACQMLALAGTARSVPALASLLRDPAAADAARYALESIPAAEAGAALRAALAQVTGNAKSGVIGSIAARHDSAASSTLATLASAADEPAVVREAAALAMENLEG